MKVLVTNDDGIHAPGLWAAVGALKEAGEIVVVAPDREQSGVGPAVTLHGPVRVREMAPLVPGVQTYAVEGTPADSVILALETLVGNVELVVSGINSGANLGDDVLMSGTVGAALHAHFRGIPAIAVSVVSLNPKSFEAAARLARTLARSLLHGEASWPLLLNVNLPDLPPEQIQGVEVTRLCGRSYTEQVRRGEDGRRRSYFWIERTRPPPEAGEGTDLWAVRHQRVSVTPLHADVTATGILPPVSTLSAPLLQAIRFGALEKPLVD